MLERSVRVLMSGSGAVVLSAALFVLLRHWRFVLLLEIGWSRREWLRLPALPAIVALRGQEEHPRLERIKLALMLAVALATAPLLWLAFVDAVAGTSLITETAGEVGDANGGSQLAWALALCVLTTGVAWGKLAAVARRRASLEREVAAYIADGGRVLGGCASGTPPAVASALVAVLAAAWAAIGLVGVIAACMAVLWRHA